MANTQDLRFIKTEKLIEDSYLQLRQKNHGAVKVSELCKEALINKTTFYSHYETIDTLHDHICRKEVKRILDGCPNADAAFSDTTVFVKSLVNTIQENLSLLRILFGEETTKQINYIEMDLLERYLKDVHSAETEMKITFAIGGAARLLIAGQGEDRVQMTIQLIKRVIAEKKL